MIKNRASELTIEIALDEGALAAITTANIDKDNNQFNLVDKPLKRKPTTIDTGDLVEINQMLCELNLSEGNDSLARGDRANALRCYREAHNYDPNNIAIYLKLAELLSDNSSTQAEAKQLLVKGMRIAPDNDLLREKFDALVKTPTRRSTRFRRIKKLYHSTTDLEQLPKHIRPLSILLLIGIFSLIVIIPLWMRYQQRVELKPISTTGLMYSNERMEFHWRSSLNTANYLFQIDSNGKVVLEHFTRECNYVLSQDDIKQLRPDYRYKWRVTPITLRREPLPGKVVESEFTLAIGRQ